MSGQPYLEIDGLEWQLFVTRNMSFWHECLSNPGHYWHSKDFGVTVPAEFLSITKNGAQTYVFKNRQNLEKYDPAVLELVKTREKVAVLQGKYGIFAEQLLRSLGETKRELTVENWENFLAEYRRFCAGLSITATLGRLYSARLEQRLRNLGVPQEKVAEKMAVLTYPREHTPLFRSQLALLESASKAQARNNTVGEHELEKWLQEYQHIPVNFCGEPWGMDEAQHQLSVFLKKDVSKEVERLRCEHQGKGIASQKLKKEIGDEEAGHYAYVLQETTLLNEFRKNIFSKVSLEVRSCFAQISTKVGLESWRMCYWLAPEETISVLQGEKLPYHQYIAQRDIAGSRVSPSGEHVPLTTSTVKILLKFLEKIEGEDKITSTREQKIVGFGASSGVVRGRVKVVLSSKDFHKVSPGDILVAPMTSVDYIPVMEKAAAFVTNEGGITSHASIVAREMGKPCVIGTKVGTKILHDGDQVEVDGGKGLVHVLD